MLVGGGELHDRWSSLVGVSEPLGRGIQRFTGITQAMVDEAPPPEARAARAGRAAARAGARRPLGAVRRRRARAGVRARRARVARPAGHVHGGAWRGGSRRCSAAAASPRWPTRSGSRSRRRTARCPDAETCARVFCALFAAAVRERAHGRRGAGAARPAQTAAAAAAREPCGGRATSGPTCPRCRRTPASTSSATPTAGRCTSASRSACARARARTSRRRRPGPARPSTSTTRRPSPSSARWCSRTG